MPTLNPQHTDAVFIGYEDQENLGLRSIMATLEANGFSTALVPYIPGNSQDILCAIKDYSPKLVGFSIIFQYSLDEFIELASALRKVGVNAHFTVGGHLPSLRPAEVLESMPQIDTVVRFEGEFTTLELLRNLQHKEKWRSIKGLAFRVNNEIVINPPRPLIDNLDSLSQSQLLKRQARTLTRGIRSVSMLASRGCLHNCSFCSIRQFYGGAPGILRRTRRPEAVVAEMKSLFEADGVRLFIFQDDDFAAKTPQQRLWVDNFLQAMDDEHLTGLVRWKISCRVDDVEKEIFARLRDYGLMMVYLGVESGNPAGLKTLNKHVTVEQNEQAVNVLKSIDLAFDMGFMLFDPDSTVSTIRENIDFLKQITGDGTCPANFCKMLPYAGTPIEERLKKEGRLKGTISNPDYDFIDPRLDWYSLYIAMTFRFRNFDRLGLVERLRTARFDQLLAQAFEPSSKNKNYKMALRKITARANAVALDYLERALSFVESRDVKTLLADWSLLSNLADPQWSAEVEIQQDLDRILREYNQDLLRVFADEFSRRISQKRESISYEAREAF
ncbi:MAG: B12-binding domain-containing radical SAM protein [Bacillota bacterium]